MTSTFELQPVDSSNIKATGHDPATGEMQIAFHLSNCPVRNGEACACVGKVYRYPDVPAEAHDKLRGAESIGSHFHAHIRKQFKGSLLVEESKA